MRRQWIIGGLAIVCMGFRVWAAEEPPVDWIDPDTGHRVVRLSKEPGTASLYFHQNAYTPDGRKLIVTTPAGLATIDLQSRQVEPVVSGKVNVIVTGRKTGDIYYVKEGMLCATNLGTKATREIVRLPYRTAPATLNADETLLAGVITEGDDQPAATRRSGAEPGIDAPPPSVPAVSATPAAPSPQPSTIAPPTGVPGRPLTYAEQKEVMLDRRLNQRIAMALYTVNTHTGEIKVIHRATDWLNHLQFSPTDPGLLMFCHEGPWHKVDRIWTIRTDGTGLTKIHERRMEMEIAGHEFWGADGQNIWYDLQTPRGEDFWVAGLNLPTGERTWYHMDRDQWSVHFNVSRDGALFAGDGGDPEMVAHARDGKWIYLFRPEIVPNYGVPSGQQGLIKSGVFRAERLVNMSKHDYKLEPNVTFTPDQKWIVFRTNMFGPTHVLAVEIAKAAGQ